MSRREIVRMNFVLRAHELTLRAIRRGGKEARDGEQRDAVHRRGHGGDPARRPRGDDDHDIDDRLVIKRRDLSYIAPSEQFKNSSEGRI